MIRTLTHSDGSKCLFDTDTQEIYKFPDTIGKISVSGKWFNWVDSIRHLMTSNAITPVLCTDVKKVGKRIKVTLMDGYGDMLGCSTYEFFNVERINDKWTHNDVELMQKGRGYFIFIEANKLANNNVIIKSSKEIAHKLVNTEEYDEENYSCITQVSAPH